MTKKQRKAVARGETVILDSGSAFVTIFRDGEIRTIGKQCPWFDEVIAEQSSSYGYDLLPGGAEVDSYYSRGIAVYR